MQQRRLQERIGMDTDDFQWEKGVNDAEYIQVLEKMLNEQCEITEQMLQKNERMAEKERQILLYLHRKIKENDEEHIPGFYFRASKLKEGKRLAYQDVLSFLERKWQV